MRVAIDATALPPERVGVAHYLIKLIREVDTISAERNVSLTIVTKASDAAELEKAAPSSRLVTSAGAARLGRPGRLAWEQSGLPRLLRRLDVDLLHSPHYTAPLMTSIPTVVVFHDATFWTNPEAHERSKVLWFRSMAALSKRRAAALITVSEASRDELARVLHVPKSRFAVTYHGVDEDWFEPPNSQEIDEVRSKFELSDAPYVLFVGTIEPRKNIARLVAAFDRIRGKIEPLKLVITGKRGWHFEEIEAAINTSRHRGEIVTTGYVSEGEKRALVHGSSVFAYPSLAEGFGIPVLEAMAAGRPVLTSNVSATAEVAGDGALTVNPLDTAAIADGLEACMSDDTVRGQLENSGPARARKFTWRQTAEATIDVWREVRSRR